MNVAPQFVADGSAAGTGSDWISRRQIQRAKAQRPGLSHLRLHESVLNPGTEWISAADGWSVVQVGPSGGYWVGLPESVELQEGTVLLLSPGACGTIRASVLGELALKFFSVQPGRLAGLLTLHELRFFVASETREEFAVQMFAPETPLAAGMHALGARGQGNACLRRLHLIELFIGAFGSRIEAEPKERAVAARAKERLETFLRSTPTSELIHLNLPELARVTGCTPRHLNRLFNEVVGMSFRDKHTELRLARACDLLAHTDAKVVDVALESGYQSLSLFNLMFTRRFGVSPGLWRKKLREGSRRQ